MPEAISDTGPILHLHEIGRLTALTPLVPLQVPKLVWAELNARGVRDNFLRAAGIDLDVVEVAEPVWREIVASSGPPQIQPADAQTFALARTSRFQTLVLTDDLALRKLLEKHGATVAGSVGLLVRAYTSGQISRDDLDHSIDAIFERSTLHLSRAFRAYLRQLLAELP